MKRKTILFVDDERSVLKAVWRSFRKMDFDIIMAESASIAFEKLKENEIDMVVSDFKMPDMNGYEFLQLVRAKYPDAIRIMLSGFTDDKIIFKSVFNGVVKSFLSKPWNDEELKSYITNVFELKDLLDSEHVKDLILRMEDLPVLPQVFEKITEAISKEESLEDIAKIIETDALLAVKILKTANSSFYDLKTTTISKAVIYMGLEAIRDMIINTAVYDSKKIENKSLPYFNRLLEHSKLSNLYFGKLHKKLTGKRVDSVYNSIGLIAHIGYVVLLINYGEKFRLFMKELEEFDSNNYEILDYKFFNISHSKICGYLLNWWNFPYNTLEAVIFHHDNDSIINNTSTVRECLEIADIMAWKKLGFLKKVYVDEKYLIEDENEFDS
ncbi:MAG: HDOD domain-containing protein [Candidatus Delongbacteria bacterium]|nr:HDOD domain-containing protein [Candidatus Delongbacteria bacterium]MBN2836696.1 HDOD domain-containing protein [Candidatus Delongbacteria bacterium]